MLPKQVGILFHINCAMTCHKVSILTNAADIAVASKLYSAFSNSVIKSVVISENTHYGTDNGYKRPCGFHITTLAY